MISYPKIKSTPLQKKAKLRGTIAVHRTEEVVVKAAHFGAGGVLSAVDVVSSK